jgi:hypothetical protein
LYAAGYKPRGGEDWCGDQLSYAAGYKPRGGGDKSGDQRGLKNRLHFLQAAELFFTLIFCTPLVENTGGGED